MCSRLAGCTLIATKTLGRSDEDLGAVDFFVAIRRIRLGRNFVLLIPCPPHRALSKARRGYWVEATSAELLAKVRLP
jgi:hypothetical protein